MSDENNCGKYMMFPHLVVVRGPSPPVFGAYVQSASSTIGHHIFFKYKVARMFKFRIENCHSSTSAYLPEVVSCPLQRKTKPHQNVSRTEAHPQCSRVEDSQLQRPPKYLARCYRLKVCILLIIKFFKADAIQALKMIPRSRSPAVSTASRKAPR